MRIILITIFATFFVVFGVACQTVYDQQKQSLYNDYQRGYLTANEYYTHLGQIEERRKQHNRSLANQINRLSDDLNSTTYPYQSPPRPSYDLQKFSPAPVATPTYQPKSDYIYQNGKWYEVGR